MAQRRIVLFIMVSSITRGGFCTYECVKQCACGMKNEVLFANCGGLNFTEVPKPEPKYQVDVLNLQYNQIATLRMGDFLLFPKLTELYLQGNRINVVEEKAFDGLWSLRKLDLSSNMIHSIPGDDLLTFASTLTWLSLAMNGLRELPVQLNNMTKLEFLDVSNNQFLTDLPSSIFPKSLVSLDMKYLGVKFLHRSAFEGLTGLKRLILSDNMASSSLKFEDRVFDDLSSLEYMDLSRSFCKKLSRNSFQKLKNLKTLLMNNCWITQPPIFARREAREFTSSGSEYFAPGTENTTATPFTTNPSSTPNTWETSTFTSAMSTNDPWEKIWYNPELSVLDLSNNRRMSIPPEGVRFPPALRNLQLSSTKLQAVDDDLFNETIWLESLDLSGARLETIAYGAFRQLRNLSEIDLSVNPLENVPDLPASLQSLELRETRISNLTRRMLGNLTDVVEADLKNGEFELIKDYAFQNMFSLKTLDLSDNKIDWLQQNALTVGIPRAHYKRDDEKMNSLTALNLASNLLRRIDEGAFSSLSRLTSLDLQGNFLSVIEPGTFDGLHSLEILKLNDNSLVDIAPNALDDLTSMQILHLEGNDLEIVFPGAFEKMEKLQQLHLQRNRLTVIHEINLPSLTLLDISHNNLTEVPEAGGELLIEIDASHNPIEEFLPGALRKATSLETLRMRNCRISDFNYSELSWPSSLKSVDLTDNTISKFADVLLPSLESLLLNGNAFRGISTDLRLVTPKISVLDLSYNKISSIDPKVFSGAKALSRLILNDNSFICDCKLYPLVAWIETHKTIVVDPQSYHCFEPQENLGDSVMDIVSQLSCGRRTIAYISIAIAVGTLAVLLLVISLFVCYRKKRKLVRNERIIDENSEPMLDERNDARDNGSQTFLSLFSRCFSPEDQSMSDEGGEQADSDECKDLMAPSPIASPSQKESPVSL